MIDEKKTTEEETSPRDQIDMTSLGVTPEDSPNYVEADDVENGIANGQY